MKNIKFTFILVLAIISFMPVAEIKAQPVSVSVNFSTFQQELSPYGRWMNNPRFGQVWINNDADFRPYYTDGHWDYTNYGWSWVSDYDWGWAPFHYGRWEYDPYYGWMWIPGYEWASAWVSWSSYDDYYGWAPLGYGVNINVSFGSIPYNNWTFIPRRNICDRDINRYYVSSGRNNNFRNAVVINNYYNGSGHVGRFVRGPERRDVERFTNNRIQERRIDYNDRRSYSGRNDNGGNNVFNRRNNDAVNRDNGNTRQGRDVNRNNNNSTTPRVNEGRRQQNDVNRPQRFPSVENNQPGNQQNENNRRRREVNTTAPQTNDNSGRRQNDNRPNRNNDQQNNFPQRQQQPERQAPQQEQQRQPRFERQAPQQQQQPRLERQAPQQQQQEQRQPRFERQAPQQQQQQPAVQQRSMERRSDGNNGGNGRRMRQ